MNTSSPALDRHPPLAPDRIAALAVHLDQILAPLLLLIAAQFRRIGPLTLPLWNRVSRARQRLARLLAHLAAGTLPAPCAPRPGRPSRLKSAPLPRGFAWLVQIIGYHAAGYGSQLNVLLAEPAMQAALAAAPSAVRTLRPLCRMLGIDLPPALQRLGLRPLSAAADAPPGTPSPAPPGPRRLRAARPVFSWRPEPAPSPVIFVFPVSG